MEGSSRTVAPAPLEPAGVALAAPAPFPVAPQGVDPAPSDPSVARQRWRLVLARSASDGSPAGRELMEAWDRALDASGLPLHRPAGRARSRIQFGAPVPPAMALERELADVVLTELIPRWRAREALGSIVPDGWRVLDLYDVWLGEPPLPGRVAAADYRIEIDGAAADLRAAASRLLAVRSLPRVRARGTDTVRYDLRPLVSDITVIADGPPAVLRVRTRFDPALGTGRPEEVVAALGEASRSTIGMGTIVREQILVAADLEDENR
jgi:uncharacterized protein DUF2344